MAYYETVMILNPTKEEKELKKEIRAYEDYIQTFSKTKKVKTDDMGEKTLAYEIKKHKTGYYVIFHYQAKLSNIEDLERRLRVDDEVLKFMTIRYGKEEAPELEDYIPGEEIKSEQEQDAKPDALDVLLGLAEYKKKEVSK